MPPGSWFALAIAGVIVALAWLRLSEGSWLGSRFTTWFYARNPFLYDAGKGHVPVDDAEYLIAPLIKMLGNGPLVILDVATGTGRVVAALQEHQAFDRIQAVGVDLSLKMLEVAQGKVPRAELAQGDVYRLPFGDGVFDAVCCTEGLEIMRKPRNALFEMERVLAPDGVMMITHRVKRLSWLFPGFISTNRLIQFVLHSLAFDRVIIDQLWSSHFILWCL